MGVTGASLPRVLICSQCGHGAFIKTGRPASRPAKARRLTREERAAEQGGGLLLLVVH